MDIQDSEARRHLAQSLQSDEREAMAEYNERLEARQEVLQDHNRRLEEQLGRLRQLVHEVELFVNNGNNTREQIPSTRKNRSWGYSGSEV